jgi:hypothetical protein
MSEQSIAKKAPVLEHQARTLYGNNGRFRTHPKANDPAMIRISGLTAVRPHKLTKNENNTAALRFYPSISITVRQMKLGKLYTA